MVRPVPTADNVSDLGTKSLKADRILCLLSKLNMCDSECGYQLVGAEHMLDAQSRRQLCRVIKQGSVNAQRILQILALALQVDAIAGEPDEPDDDQDALSHVSTSLLSWIGEWLTVVFLVCADLIENHPTCAMLFGQFVMLVFLICAMCFCQSRRRCEPRACENTQVPKVEVNVVVDKSSLISDRDKPEPAEIPNLDLPQRENEEDDDQPDPTAASSSAPPNAAQPSASTSWNEVEANLNAWLRENALPILEQCNAPPRTPDHPSVRDPEGNHVVFVTASRGYAFHRARECPKLRCAKRILRYTKREAIRRGFKPCKECGA